MPGPETAARETNIPVEELEKEHVKEQMGQVPRRKGPRERQNMMSHETGWSGCCSPRFRGATLRKGPWGWGLDGEK